MIMKAKLEIDNLLAIELIKARTLFRNFPFPEFCLTISSSPYCKYVFEDILTPLYMSYCFNGFFCHCNGTYLL